MAPTQNSSSPTARPQPLPLDLTPPARGYFTIDTPTAFAPRGLTPTALEGLAPSLAPFRSSTQEFWHSQPSRGYSPGAVPAPTTTTTTTLSSRPARPAPPSVVSRPAQRPRSSSRREEYFTDYEDGARLDDEGQRRKKYPANNWYDQLVRQELEREAVEREWLAGLEPREDAGKKCSRSNDTQPTALDTGTVLRYKYRISQEERAAGTFITLFRKYQEGLAKKRNREAVEGDVEQTAGHKLRRNSPPSAGGREGRLKRHMRKQQRQRLAGATGSMLDNPVTATGANEMTLCPRSQP